MLVDNKNSNDPSNDPVDVILNSPIPFDPKYGYATDPKIIERQMKVFTLRTSGLTWPEIAKLVNANKNTVISDNRKIQASRWMEFGNELKQILANTLAELDEIKESFSDQMKNGDYRAGEIVLQALKQQAALLGLDSPFRVAAIEKEKNDDNYTWKIEYVNGDAYRDPAAFEAIRKGKLLPASNTVEAGDELSEIIETDQY
ncbi:MAG: hypothetical protein J0I20_34605 [Chloroflexi bacterium]|nr:hypothetical protein [Chloroflexota bacterium]OJV89777.1 MAG: hypothetical protein BGO39_28965 [Chloroflexi bacterium 54-19]